MTRIRCPRCLHDWPHASEYAAAIDLLGCCLWCKFKPGADGTEEDLASVLAEAKRRRNTIEYVNQSD